MIGAMAEIQANGSITATGLPDGAWVVIGDLKTRQMVGAGIVPIEYVFDGRGLVPVVIRNGVYDDIDITVTVGNMNTNAVIVSGAALIIGEQPVVPVINGAISLTIYEHGLCSIMLPEGASYSVTTNADVEVDGAEGVTEFSEQHSPIVTIGSW